MIRPGELTLRKVGILEAVRAQLALTDAGVPGRVCLYPGAEVAWDDCECGLLAVHHTNVYPSDRFPDQKLEGPFNRCAPKLWVADIRVTVVRCAPETDDETPPSCDALNDATVVQDVDIEAMHAGVECALRGMFQRIVAHTPVGPGGQCVGSELSVLTGIANCPAECP